MFMYSVPNTEMTEGRELQFTKADSPPAGVWYRLNNRRPFRQRLDSLCAARFNYHTANYIFYGDTMV